MPRAMVFSHLEGGSNVVVEWNVGRVSIRSMDRVKGNSTHFETVRIRVRCFGVGVRVRVRVGCFVVTGGHKWVLYGRVAKGGGRGSASGLWLEGMLCSMLIMTVMLGGDLDAAT